MAKQILQRYGTAADLNPITGTAGTNREIALEVDGSGVATGQIRVMDGVTNGGLVIAPLPAGIIMPFANDTAPDGFLECNGASLNRASYASLFSAIGTTWGDGDDAGNTFALPDLRGAFLRGTGTGSINSRDKIGGDVGSFQEDETMNATGSARFGGIFSYSYPIPVTYADGIFARQGNNSTKVARYSSGTADGGNNTETLRFDLSQSVRTGAEIRPYNAGILYCIKY